MTVGQSFLRLNRRRQHPLAWLRRTRGAAAVAAVPTVMNYDRWYDMAFTSYKNIWNAQNESDKQKAEMVVLALSIVSSTVLMASFATNSLGVLAGRTAQHWLASNNLNKTLSVLNLIGENKQTMFALGAIGNAAEAKVKKYITDQARALLGGSSMPAVTSPLAIQNDLMNFVDKSHYQIREVVLAMEKDQSIGDAERRQIIAVLQTTPICKPPVNTLDRDKLRDHIELSLHMSALLDSDFILDVPAHELSQAGTVGAAFLTKAKPILELPSSPNYPKTTSPKISMGVIDAHKRIRFYRPGSMVISKIEELNSKIFPDNLFSSTVWGGANGGPPPALTLAEEKLNLLADKSRPLQINTARI